MKKNTKKLEPLMVPFEGAKEEVKDTGLNINIEYEPPRSMLQKVYDMFGVDNVKANVSIKFKK